MNILESSITFYTPQEGGPVFSGTLWKILPTTTVYHKLQHDLQFENYHRILQANTK
jgi:hypothetical protein